MSAVDFQGHDFSMRGMTSLDAAMASGAGHLLSFTGTDTIPAILYLEKYYNANIEQELVGSSIPASEHSVACAYGTNELETYRHLINKVHPSGFVSIVSDTWDLWKILTDVIPALKEDILARDGRVVIRPDSGDPVKIVCGDPESENPIARKGIIEILWEIFGGTTTSKGYKQLDSHIGCIYGDAITLDRCRAICEQLTKKGFASTNMVFGIGSYTYQYQTRDTFGFALKSTYGVFGGEERFLFKDPVTDSGVKKSQTGRVCVFQDSGGIHYVDGLRNDKSVVVSSDVEGEEARRVENLLQLIYENGVVLKDSTLSEVRKRLWE